MSSATDQRQMPENRKVSTKKIHDDISLIISLQQPASPDYTLFSVCPKDSGKTVQPDSNRPFAIQS
jgi:hypothetical protein